MSTEPPENTAEDTAENTTEKALLRRALLAARAALTAEEREGAAEALARAALDLPELAEAGTVAAYVSVGREPGTRALLDVLRARGVRVLLPVLLPDNDLDWAPYTGPASLAPARRGLLEPVSATVGVEAVATADVVLVPGLAVGADGTRLGRGGGSYDRALGRVPVGTFTCVLLYDDERLPVVPTEPHDRPVTAAATPAGITRF